MAGDAGKAPRDFDRMAARARPRGLVSQLRTGCTCAELFKPQVGQPELDFGVIDTAYLLTRATLAHLAD